VSRENASVALAGHPGGFVCGLTWIPADVLVAIARGSGDAGSIGPAEALATLATAAEADFAFVPAGETWSLDAVESLVAADISAVWTVSGVLGRVAQDIGWTQALRLTVSQPGQLAGSLAEALNEAVIDARVGLAAGADALLVADDLAGATGPLVSPDFALDALLPCYHHIAIAVATEGIPSVFHSDGDVRALMPALARAGFSAVHLAGIAEDGWNASYAAARSEGLAVLGGIEAMSVEHGVRRVGERAGRFALADGLLVCDDGGITTAEEVVAVTAALDVAREVHAAGSSD
jgi:hypothetical protein